MHDPVKKKSGWFVDTPDGESGPWFVKAAAEAAADGNVMQANMINNRAMSRDKTYHKGSNK